MGEMDGDGDFENSLKSEILSDGEEKEDVIPKKETDISISKAKLDFGDDEFTLTN